MTIVTLKINTKSNKGKHLLGLITEMAKEKSVVEIEKSETYKEIDSAIIEMKTGKTKSSKQFLEEL
jgi:hypothetical protein